MIVNKNVMHSETATGHMQAFNTYIISKILSSKSEHSIFIGWYQIYENYTTGDFPFMDPFGDTSFILAGLIH